MERLFLGFALIFLGFRIYSFWFRKMRSDQPVIIATPDQATPKTTAPNIDVKTDTRNLFHLLITLAILAPLFLYFTGVRIETFIHNSISNREILMVAFVVAIVAFSDVVRSSSEVRSKLQRLNKPLWGFKETSEGYTDTSTKHPYVLAVIVLIIIISFAYMLFGMI